MEQLKAIQNTSPEYNSYSSQLITYLHNKYYSPTALMLVPNTVPLLLLSSFLFFFFLFFLFFFLFFYWAPVAGATVCTAAMFGLLY
jgi:hypothetical protein